ncbi:TPA: DUF4330 domain-containing protein [Candidatus Galligastranaerophilus intestinigallinarum]|nr:DUF4330 domain-containing protein [Candidatus Galligastranaerophilus intestinigallinarum]
MNFLKKLRPFDIVVIVLIVAALMVFVATKTGKRTTSSEQIEAETKVDIEVYFRGVVVTSKNSPFKEGDETFITIRNVPYTKLKIKSASYERKKIMLPAAGSKYQVVEDLTSPFNYDFLVTVQDDAKITKDGAVVGGNKIKIGLPVTLEGKDYKLNGVVSNITLSKEADETVINNDLDAEVNKNQDVH